MSSFFALGDGNALVLPDGRQLLGRHVSTAPAPELGGWPHWYRLTVWTRAGFNDAWHGPVVAGPEVAPGGGYRLGTGRLFEAAGVVLGHAADSAPAYPQQAVLSRDGGTTWVAATAAEATACPTLVAAAAVAGPVHIAWRASDGLSCAALNRSGQIAAGRQLDSAAPVVLLGATLTVDIAPDPAVAAGLDGSWAVVCVVDGELHHWRSGRPDGVGPWTAVARRAVSAPGLVGAQLIRLADGRFVLAGAETVSRHYRGRQGVIDVFVGEPVSATVARWSGPWLQAAAGQGYAGSVLAASGSTGPADTDPYLLELPDGRVECGWVEGDGRFTIWRAVDPAGTWTEVR